MKRVQPKEPVKVKSTYAGFQEDTLPFFLLIGNGYVYSYIPLDAWSVNVAAEVIAKVTSELYTEVNAEVSKAVSAEVTTELRQVPISSQLCSGSRNVERLVVRCIEAEFASKQ